MWRRRLPRAPQSCGLAQRFSGAQRADVKRVMECASSSGAYLPFPVLDDEMKISFSGAATWPPRLSAA